MWRDRARRLEAAADALGKDPDSLEHADIARSAFTRAAKWIADLRAGEPNASAAQAPLRSAAHAIDPSLPLREQAEAVERFFDTAAAAFDTAA